MGGLLLLALLLAVAAGMFQLTTPAVVPRTAPETAFSAARAMQHLEEIAREPHPIGSPANARVRDYLVAQLRSLGLQTQVQTTTAVQKLPQVRLGAVQNVVTRLTGMQPGPAIMLTAHYDSVATGPGASDDGAAVAAMLETARALIVGPPLQHDLILLFTDGEEAGLLGARAFVGEHPWAKDVALTLNFEARGSRGPAGMFETSAGNRALIGEFAQAVPYPVAYSFLSDIYGLMPNDTDLTALKALDTQALNFAYVFDGPAYHSSRDTLATIDPRSLQHHGSYMLALTQHYGNRPFGPASEQNATFFTLWPGVLVHYAEVWVFPLAVAVALLFVAVLSIGLRRNVVSVRGLAGGFAAFLLSAVLSLVVVTLIWWAIQQVNANYRVLLAGTTYEAPLYLLAFVALIGALMSGLGALLLRKSRASNLVVGALGVWTVLLLITSVELPGVSYLFTWPLLAALVAALWRMRLSDRQWTPWSNAASLALAAIPGIVLFTPAIYLLFAMLGLSLGRLPVVGVSLLLAPLLGGLLIPHLAALSPRARVFVPASLSLLSAALILVANLQSGFEPGQPKPTSLMYRLDADTGTAAWISLDEAPNDWTAQFLGEHVEHRPVEIMPGRPLEALSSAAPALPLSSPKVDVLGDTTVESVRTLRLRVTSARQPWKTSVRAHTPGGIRAVTVAGRRFDLTAQPVEQRTSWSLSYFALPQQGVELTIELARDEPVTLAVSDITHGLPELPGETFRPRPANMMPAPTELTDSTEVNKTFQFDSNGHES